MPDLEVYTPSTSMDAGGGTSKTISLDHDDRDVGMVRLEAAEPGVIPRSSNAGFELSVVALVVRSNGTQCHVPPFVKREDLNR